MFQLIHDARQFLAAQFKQIIARGNRLIQLVLVRLNLADQGFHICGREKLSRYEIGKLLVARTPGMEAKITADTLKNYHGAPRTPDVSMNCAKAQAVLPFPLPGLTEWLAANPNEPF